MSLTAAEVAEIMRLVEQSTFDELTLEMDGVKLSLRRGAAVQANGAALPAGVGLNDASLLSSATGLGGAAGAAGGAGNTSSAGAAGGAGNTSSAGTGGRANVGASAPRASATGGTPSGAAATHAKATGGKPQHTPPDANSHDVVSPLLGTFYRAPKPGAPAFVELGATVEEETVIAIIEVMKLMNTVRAGVRGTVTDIFVADGALVEFEQPLIRVSKTG